VTSAEYNQQNAPPQSSDHSIDNIKIISYLAVLTTELLSNFDESQVRLPKIIEERFAVTLTVQGSLDARSRSARCALSSCLSA